MAHVLFQGAGFRASTSKGLGLGFRIWGLRLRVWGLRLRV